MTEKKRLEDLEDWELLDEVANSDHQAVSEMFRRYGKAVFSFIFRMLRQRESAEDACQDVFVRLWRKAPSFEKRDAQFTSLLFGIARNVALEYLRKIENLAPISPDIPDTTQPTEFNDPLYKLALDEMSDPGNWRRGQPLPNLAFHLAVYRRRAAGIEERARSYPRRGGHIVKGPPVIRRYLWLRLWAGVGEESVDSAYP